MEYLDLLNKYRLHALILFIVIYVIYKKLNYKYDISGNKIKNY